LLLLSDSIIENFKEIPFFEAEYVNRIFDTVLEFIKEATQDLSLS